MDPPEYDFDDEDDFGIDLATIDEDYIRVMKNNDLLVKENRLLDSYLHRKKKELEEVHEIKERKSRKNKKEQQALTLSDFEKYHLAHDEQDYRTKQLKEFETKAAEDINLLKAITKGIKIRTDELRRETYEFKRDICIGAQNARTGTVMAERVIRYFEESLKSKTALIEKMNLKINQLKQHRLKMDAQIKHTEQGDSLHSIDFHQLQIKNSQFNQKITELNTELLNTKMTTGKTVQALNSAKRDLNELTQRSKDLKRSISDHKASLEKHSKELKRVELEVKKEKKKNRKYKIQQSNPDMPQVLDYINQKSDMYEQQAAVRNWERKIEIITLAARRARKTLERFHEIGYVVDAVGNLSVPRARDGPGDGIGAATYGGHQGGGGGSSLPPIGTTTIRRNDGGGGGGSSHRGGGSRGSQRSSR